MSAETRTNDRRASHRSARRRLRTAYITGLVIIAGLAATKAHVSSIILARTKHDAATINIAGQQRMLSQKIAKAALRYEHAATQADAVDAHDELAETLMLWTSCHEALRYGSASLGIPSSDNPELIAAYAEIQPLFDAIRNATVALLIWEETHTLADQHAPEVLAAIETILEYEKLYLPAMWSIVNKHEAEAGERIAELILAKNALLLATILALLIEAAIVFEPAVRTMSRQLRTIDEQRKRAEGLAKHKATFLANMSHEIRTPMTAILGYADLMLEPELTPSQRAAHIQTIRSNGEHLLGLINDILDTSKIEAGKLDVERVACEPHQLVEDAMSLMRNRAHLKGLELSASTNGPIATSIAADPLRIRQILVNLISNAIKFTSKGSVDVTTRMSMPTHSAADEADAQHWLEISVTDTGIGIEPEMLGGIFHPFDQAETSTTRRFGGTGLGLSISKSLAEAMGGSIAVESTPGAGSTFKLRLPAGREPNLEIISNQHIPTEAELLPAGIQGQLLRGMRILLAEDATDNQRLFTFHLTKAGADVVVVGDGQQAIDAACNSDDTFDVVLMDVQMPVLDGLVATSTIRQRGVMLPILALTANAMPEDRERCITAGCDDFLSKPINADKLVHACLRWSKRKPRLTPTHDADRSAA